MEWRDIARFFGALTAMLVTNYGLRIGGFIDSHQDDFNTAAVIAIGYALLRAIREDHSSPPR